MLNINASANKTSNTVARGVHYLPTMKLSDNKRIGGSYAFDGVTPAKGTLYPTTMNNQAGIGAIQTLINSEYSAYSDFAKDFDFYTNDEVKHKTAENYFQKYKNLKGLKLAFVQYPLQQSTSSIFSGVSVRLAKNKLFPLTATTFVMVYQQSGGTSGFYAVVGTVDGATGGITYGTPALLNVVGSADDYNGVVEIDTGKYAFVVHQTTVLMRNIIFTVSGTTISVGTGVDVTVATMTLGGYFISCEKVDTNKYMTIFHNPSGGSMYGYVTTVSGTVPTNGAVLTFAFSAYAGSKIAFSSATAGLIAYSDSGTQPRALAFTISGTTITAGSVISLNTTNTTGAFTSYYSPLVDVLPNGLYYVSSFIGSYGFAYYVSVVGTTCTLVETVSQMIDIGSGYTDGAGVLKLSATKWVNIIRSSSIEYLVEYNYEASTGRIYTVRKDLPENKMFPAPLNITLKALLRVGNQYIILGGNASYSPAMFHITTQVGSCEVYFEDEVTPCATISNPSVGWAYDWATFTKTVNKVIAFFSLKNKTGNPVQIKTYDWLFEVE